MKIIKDIVMQEPFFYLELFIIISAIVFVTYILSKISTFIKNKIEIRKFNKEQNKVLKDKEELRKMNERARIRKPKNYW